MGYLVGANIMFTRPENSDGLEGGFNTLRWTYNLSLANEDAYHGPVPFALATIPKPLR